MPNIDEAIEALLAYQQADMEGVMVLTSRQAIHEVADELRRLRDAAQSMKEPMNCECGFIVEVCATNPCMRKKVHLAGLTPGSKWPEAAPLGKRIEDDATSHEAKPFMMLSCREAGRCLHNLPGCICEIDPASADTEPSSADSDEVLLANAQRFVDRKYVARADARQKSMGLAYIEAERQDLAREIVRFVRSIGHVPQASSVGTDRLSRAKAIVEEAWRQTCSGAGEFDDYAVKLIAAALPDEPQTAQAGDWINEPLRNWAATPAPLINGAVYDLSDFGPGEYIGIDVFHGETTHKFKTSDGLRYIKPERLAAALSRPQGKTPDPSKKPPASEWKATP